MVKRGTLALLSINTESAFIAFLNVRTFQLYSSISVHLYPVIFLLPSGLCKVKLGHMNNFLNNLNLTPIKRLWMDSDYCELCNKSFESRRFLAEHKLLHSVNGFHLNLYKCRSCPKKFDKRQEFEKHVNSHSGRRRYVCIICNKGFSFKAKWQTHLDSHSDGRIHYCQLCTKQFNTEESLKMHESTHFYVKKKYNTKSLLNSGKYYVSSHKNHFYELRMNYKKRGRPKKTDITDRKKKKKIGRPRKTVIEKEMEEYKPQKSSLRLSGAIEKRNKLEEERLQLESLGFFQEKVKRRIGRPRKTEKMEESLKKMQLLNSVRKENDDGLVVELYRIKIEDFEANFNQLQSKDTVEEKKRGRPKKNVKGPPKKKLKPITEEIEIKKPRGRPKTKKSQCDNIIKNEEIEEKEILTDKLSIKETSTLLQVILNEGDFKMPIDSNDINEINLSPKQNNITLEDLINTLES